MLCISYNGFRHENIPDILAIHLVPFKLSLLTKRSKVMWAAHTFSILCMCVQTLLKLCHVTAHVIILTHSMSICYISAITSNTETSVTFHIKFASSVWAAEWPPLGKKLLTPLTICSLRILTICNFSYFPFWF